ncbi:MAG TPA: D-Ala-D-Ala carboxypeptidase family metallohydrolase [Beijerinckiaceae bacterium]|nr:D-Ala-D-Ala carboxypeptidase family metallohydrolase [Beijerinckiaceae bacterium]
MRIYCWFAVAASGLSLAACSPSGQPELQANLSADGTPQAGVVAGTSAGTAARNAPTGGLFGALFPTQPTQVAQAEPEQVIASTFVAPKKAPLPVARPDFGDRVEVAAAPATAAPHAPAEPAQATASQAPPSQATPSIVTAFAAPEQPAAIPAVAEPAAQARSIAAYEREEAGIPANDKGPAQQITVGPTPASFGALPTTGTSSNGVPFTNGNQRWYAAYPTVETDCFPADLRSALDTIARHYNRPVEVTSGMRNRGRRYSMHRYCKAADIRVAGVSPSALASFAKTVPGINGVGTYRWVAVTHIDTRAERFAWRY